MKKFLVSIIILAIFFPFVALGQTDVETVEQINARILPSIWYSTLFIKDGDSVRIYAGIQNNSGVDFNGKALFYVDEENISEVSFVSRSDSLNAVSADWVVSSGTHDIQVKITTSLPDDKVLVSYETSKSSINITRKITQEMIKDTVVDTVYNVITKVDEAVVPLVEKLQDLKKPTEGELFQSSSKVQNRVDGDVVLEEESGSVLGASTQSSSIGDKKIAGISLNYIFNLVIDGATFLLKHWLWTLGGIVLLFILVKFRKRRKSV